MTLYKLVSIVLSVLLLLILTTVMILNFKNVNESIQERLYEDAQNTAASLSLSLGTVAKDIDTMKIMINANFDSGNYALISLVDMEGNTLYEKQQERALSSVPKWFKQITNIEAPIASANVSSGWNVVGILNVKSDDEYAYAHLYQISKELIVSFGIIFFVSLLALNFLIALVLKPLKTIQKQAEAITRNHFIINNKLPKTKEFRDVVISMNIMINKIQKMFQKANEELKILKEREYIDSLTNLKNRKYFINKLPQYLKIDSKYKTGTNMILAFNGVIEANKKIGYKEVDNLFKELSKIFQNVTKYNQEAIVARMNGTEFSIFLPGTNIDIAIEKAKYIKVLTQKKIQQYNLDEKEIYLDIGLYEYTCKDSISKLLSASDNALLKAKLSNEHLYYERINQDEDVMGKNEWRELISNAIKNDGIKIITQKVIDTNTKATIHEALSISLETNDRYFTYGEFIAAAIEVDLVDDLYKKVIELLLSIYECDFKGKMCSLRLSNEFLHEPDTYKFLQDVFEKYAKNLKFNLVIEIPDKFISSCEENVELYKNLFERYNISLGVFEFIGESGDYNYFQNLKPLYIKSDVEFFLTHESLSLNALKLLTDSMDIELIATGVKDIKIVDELKKIDIHVVQGPVTELIS